MSVLIIATNDEEARAYARRLLDAAQDPALVLTRTTWSGNETGKVAYEVPEEVAEAAGFALDFDDDSDDSEPTPDAPGRNASRAQWAAFLDAQDPPIEYPDDAGRDDLVALWDEHNSK